MATSMWRMNGICRRMAGVLVLCTLLISSKVMCQDDTVVDVSPTAKANDDGAGAAVPTGSSTVPAPPETSVTGSAPAAAGDEISAVSASAPGDSAPVTSKDNEAVPGAQDGGTLVTTPAPVVNDDGEGSAVTDAPDKSSSVKVVVPEVVCVGKEDLPESGAVKAIVQTTDCETTKRIILENAAPWCHTDNCNIQIFQEDNKVSVASSDASHSTLASALKSEHLKDKLGVTKTETPSSSGSSVLVGILVTGLLCALAITMGYFKCQRKTEPKGAKLAEEAYPVDQENQGNTLVSVAPLNPTPETQEKPSVNGESPEAPKTEPAPPPTNGHSTTKTADTEL